MNVDVKRSIQALHPRPPPRMEWAAASNRDQCPPLPRPSAFHPKQPVLFPPSASPTEFGGSGASPSFDGRE